MPDELLSDDLLPNEGGIFQPQLDETLIQEVNAEKAMVQAAAPLLDHILAWFDQEIAQARTIQGIDLESRVKVEAQIKAKQVLATKLQEAKGRLVTMRDEYIK